MRRIALYVIALLGIGNGLRLAAEQATLGGFSPLANPGVYIEHLLDAPTSVEQLSLGSMALCVLILIALISAKVRYITIDRNIQHLRDEAQAALTWAQSHAGAKASAQSLIAMLTQLDSQLESLALDGGGYEHVINECQNRMQHTREKLGSIMRSIGGAEALDRIRLVAEQSAEISRQLTALESAVRQVPVLTASGQSFVARIDALNSNPDGVALQIKNLYAILDELTARGGVLDDLMRGNSNQNGTVEDQVRELRTKRDDALGRIVKLEQLAAQLPKLSASSEGFAERVAVLNHEKTGVIAQVEALHEHLEELTDSGGILDTLEDGDTDYNGTLEEQIGEIRTDCEDIAQRLKALRMQHDEVQQLYLQFGPPPEVAGSQSQAAE